jgi:hypothetical protein
LTSHLGGIDALPAQRLTDHRLARGKHFALDLSTVLVRTLPNERVRPLSSSATAIGSPSYFADHPRPGFSFVGHSQDFFEGSHAGLHLEQAGLAQIQDALAFACWRCPATSRPVRIKRLISSVMGIT